MLVSLARPASAAPVQADCAAPAAPDRAGDVARGEEGPCPVEIASGFRPHSPSASMRVGGGPSRFDGRGVAVGSPPARRSPRAWRWRNRPGSRTPSAACPARSARPRPRRSRSGARSSEDRRRVAEHRLAPGRTAMRASHRAAPAAAASPRPPRPPRRTRSARRGGRRAAAGPCRARPTSATGRRTRRRSVPRGGRAGHASRAARRRSRAAAAAAAGAGRRRVAGHDRLVRPDLARRIGPDRAQAVGTGTLGDRAGEGERRGIGVVLGLLVLAADRTPRVERDAGRLELRGQGVGAGLDLEFLGRLEAVVRRERLVRPAVGRAVRR